MRKTFSGIMTVAAAGLMAVSSFSALADNKGEKSLLGVQIWESKWKDVLAKHGQPTRIEVGVPASSADSSAGGMGGGAPAMGGMGAPGGMMGGKGGLPGIGGMGMGGNMMNSMQKSMQYSRRNSGGEDGGASVPGGFGPPSLGAPGGSAGPGGDAGGDAAAATPEDEVTWVYERGTKINPLTYFFLFNRDGRLIQVQTFGYKNGGNTSKGIALGDTVAKIFGLYGWTGNMTKDMTKGTMVLDYSKEHNVGFQLADRHDGKGFRVVGITVALTDKKDIPGNNKDEDAKP